MTLFSGLITALITPFKNYAIDFASLDKLINHQIEGDIKSIVVAGSTGEAPTLSMEEYVSLVKATIESSQGKLNVIAGCSSSSTKNSVEMAVEAEKLGAAGLMCSPPPYNKPTQGGIYEHFKMIHDNTNIPIMLYAAPGRTGVDFTDDTIMSLAELPRITAIKDCGGDLERPLRIMRKLGDKVSVLSGDDPITLSYNAQGAKGLVSPISNLFPKAIKQVQDLWANGNHAKALELQIQLLPLYQALFSETNPIAIKYAASLLGLCEAELRLPLCPPSLSNQQNIEIAINEIKRTLKSL